MNEPLENLDLIKRLFHNEHEDYDEIKLHKHYPRKYYPQFQHNHHPHKCDL
jgi:hypothetical protein